MRIYPFLLLLLSCAVMAQCPTGVIDLDGQAEVDQFISDYPNCTDTDDDIEIGGNVTDLSGLIGLKTIGGSLYLTETTLTNLAGLNNITSVGYNLAFERNSNLVNVEGLEKVETVGNDLRVWENSNMTSLEGLNGLTAIGDDLSIEINQNLESLDGLDILAVVPGGIQIASNPKLADCSSVCALIAVVGSPQDIVINGNLMGCNSQVELEENCVENGIEDLGVESLHLFYPNPASDFVVLREENTFDFAGLYDVQGQLVRAIQFQNGKADVSALNAGVYLLKFQGKSGDSFFQSLIIK